MNLTSTLLTLGLFVLSVSAVANPPTASRDPSSFSNVDWIVTTHFHLNLEADFDNEVLHGTVTLDLKCLQDTQQVVLDYQGLEIYSAQQEPDGDILNFELVTPNPAIGSAVIIYLKDKLKLGDTVSITVAYSTTSEGDSLSFMKAEQTDSKVLPYVFSQCEANHCRALAPLQDTPSIKTTYSADIKVPEAFVVAMSAVNTNIDKSEEGYATYSFELDIEIPSYLLAIAIGNLETRELGTTPKRQIPTYVITEPTMIEKCANELVTLPDLVQGAEDYLTDYIWPSYAILVLPPSFPFGGMENPLLTFASPTIIVGDQSQVYVATHEICHSWTGNDVTCENWSNMWLNEGFTVFEERKVSGAIHGENFALVEALLGNSDLQNSVDLFGPDSSYSSLYPNTIGVAPDDSYSEVCYEKGFQFLTFLESLVGEDEFQSFLQYYILKRTKSSINYEVFRHDWEEYITDNHDSDEAAQIINSVDWDLWIWTPGMPPKLDVLDFSNPDQQEADDLADQYVDLAGDASPENYEDYNDFYSNQKVLFLLELVARKYEFDTKLMAKIDEDLDITNDINPEVKERWYPLGIEKGYQPVFEPAHDFISTQGRSKYLNPIYQALWDYGYQTTAYMWFNENKDFYHPIAVNSLQNILQDTLTASPENLQMARRLKAMRRDRRIRF